MVKIIFKNILSLIISVHLLSPVSVFAAEGIDLQDLALPTDVKEMGKSSGAVYYSSTSKNRPLMPVHIWGEVGRPGLHFIPLDSKLVKGLSFAGGGTSLAKLDEVVVNRVENGKLVRKEFDLTEGGNIDAFEYTLKSGDTVFLEKDRSLENRTYYTGLIAVAVTILSGLLIYKRLEDK